MALVGVEQVAKILNITRRRVQQLVAEGMPRAERGRYDLGACMAWYIRYLQRALERRELPTEDGASGDIRRQRARLLRANADSAEMELAQKRGELIPIEVFRVEMGSMITTLRANLLNLPGRVAPQLEGENRAVIKHKLRNEVFQEHERLGTSTGDIRLGPEGLEPVIGVCIGDVSFGPICPAHAG